MFVAHCTLDDMVKITDVSTLQHRMKDGDFDLEAYEQGLQMKPNHGKLKEEERKNTSKGDEENWSDDSDSDSDMDSDSSDGPGNKKQKKKDKTLNPKKASLGASKKNVDD